MGGKTSLDLGNAGGGTSLKHLLSTEIKQVGNDYGLSRMGLRTAKSSGVNS